MGEIESPPSALMDRLRSELDVPPSLADELAEYRASEEYRALYELPAPRVSVCVVTYNRQKLLTERCLASVLGQTYSNLEVIVAGDGCTDETEEAVRRLADPRVRFVNGPRGKYPDFPILRWMVAGTVPGNLALSMVTGDLLTHVDDDDEFPPDRIQKLVRFLQKQRVELVHHPFLIEADGGWMQWPGKAFEFGQVTNGSTLYLAWFKRVACDPTCYRYPEPADWNRFRKFVYLGVKTARHPEPLLRHFRERTQHPERGPGA
jgi:glycosyltransferase involved in cell wall biosynthesis